MIVLHLVVFRYIMRRCAPKIFVGVVKRQLNQLGWVLNFSYLSGNARLNGEVFSDIIYSYWLHLLSD